MARLNAVPLEVEPLRTTSLPSVHNPSDATPTLPKPRPYDATPTLPKIGTKSLPRPPAVMRNGGVGGTVLSSGRLKKGLIVTRGGGARARGQVSA